MGVILGLLAAIAYGSADFCGGLATKRTSTWAVTVVSQSFGLILFVCILPLLPGHPQPMDFVWGALAGLCGGAGIALLYYALSVGAMGVVSPITAVLAASVPVLFGTLRGEHLSLLQTIGIVLALIAVVMISLSSEGDGTPEFATAGVKAAVASGLILGAFYIFLAHAGNDAGLFPLLSARLASIGLLTVLALAFRQSLRPSRASLPLIAVAGVIDMSANVLYIIATFHSYLSIAAVLTSLYPVSTVLLAAFVLRERLRAVQYAGLACALGAVAMIAS